MTHTSEIFHIYFDKVVPGVRDNKVKAKAIPITGHEGPQGCEMAGILHFSNNQLTDGGEVVSLAC
jgi:hypothetical protein